MTAAPPTIAEIVSIREQVRGTLAEAQIRSQESGRPLMILVGEDHISKHAALLEAIIYQEARRIGVHDVALEIRPSRSTLPDTIIMSDLVVYASDVTYEQARINGDQLHFIAPESNVSTNATSVAMATNLSAIPRSTLAAVGSMGHLADIANDSRIRDNYEVIAFDVVAPQLRLRESVSELWADTPSTLHELTLQGDPRELTDDQLIRLALGSEADAFINSLERRGQKMTPDAASAILDSPSSSLRNRVSALVESGQLEQAGVDFMRGRADTSGGQFIMDLTAPLVVREAFQEEMLSLQSPATPQAPAIRQRQ